MDSRVGGTRRKRHGNERADFVSRDSCAYPFFPAVRLLARSQQISVNVHLTHISVIQPMLSLMWSPGRFLGVFKGILRVLRLVWERQRIGCLTWPYSVRIGPPSKTMFSTLSGRLMITQSSSPKRYFLVSQDP